MVESKSHCYAWGQTKNDNLELEAYLTPRGFYPGPKHKLYNELCWSERRCADVVTVKLGIIFSSLLLSLSMCLIKTPEGIVIGF